MPIKSYSSSDASKFRDWLIEQGMSNSTLKRVFSSVKAIINLSINEYGLDITNPFSKAYLPSIENEIRESIALEDIRVIQTEYKKEDDELRWLLLLLSDSGMRLSEALGLSKDDINLNTNLPHVKLIPHKWRRLKNRNNRIVRTADTAYAGLEMFLGFLKWANCQYLVRFSSLVNYLSKTVRQSITGCPQQLQV